MSYIVVVNPAILSTAGVSEGPSLVATALVAATGCYLMAFYANRPFAIAPYMGENAFIAYTVCKGLGFPWQTALAAIFIAAAGAGFLDQNGQLPGIERPMMADAISLRWPRCWEPLLRALTLSQQRESKSEAAPVLPRL